MNDLILSFLNKTDLILKVPIGVIKSPSSFFIPMPFFPKAHFTLNFLCKVIFIYYNMHQLNVLIYGPSTFLSTLNELKPFLKFNHFIEKSNNNIDVIFS